MSKEKALALMQMTTVEKRVYLAQRNQRAFWQNLNHKEWTEFCKSMGKWFKNDATDEWDDYIISNNKRKAASALAALASKYGLAPPN